MNIKILDSWLREFLETSANPQEIARQLTLTSVSIERLEKYTPAGRQAGNDWTYDIEITTNRPDLASVNGLAREAAAVLPQTGIKATYKGLISHSHSREKSVITKQNPSFWQFDYPELTVEGLVQNPGPGVVPPSGTPQDDEQNSRNDKGTPRNNVLTIKVDTKLVNRVRAVVMDVHMEKSPEYMKDRLEASGIRSLNNLIDITNLCMRVTGQPTHVFDYDRLGGTELIIREAKRGEKITTLDDKDYVLNGGEVIAENPKGEIVDLLGIMGLKNSVVTDQTKRIVFFVNNIDSTRIRKASMGLGIRTEAAQLNEKHLDPNLCDSAFHYGIKLYQDLARGRVISGLIDYYPNIVETKEVSVPFSKIDQLIGVPVPKQHVIDILTRLGFHVETNISSITVTVPSFRAYDIDLPEDIIEEVARVYGYHNLPSVLPLFNTSQTGQTQYNGFYWEQRTKNALRYWGFTEVYTNSMVSETLYEGSLDKAVTITNPLTEEFVYMRSTLVPSLLQVLSDNKNRETVSLFEISNVYLKQPHKLPEEVRMLAGVIKKPDLSYFTIKGYIEQLFKDLGISHYEFRPSGKGGFGADIIINSSILGSIEILDSNLINFELNFDQLLKHVSLRKTYVPSGKFPPILEDIAFTIPSEIFTGEVIEEIKALSPLIQEVSLLDRYEETRTFHLAYQDLTKNLTNEEAKEIHNNIVQHLKKKWEIREKSN